MNTIYSFLFLLFSSYAPSYNSIADLPCRGIMEVKIVSETNARVMQSKVPIHAADKDGKMVFDLEVLKQETALYTYITPRTECLLPTYTSLELIYSDDTRKAIGQLPISESTIVWEMSQSDTQAVTDKTVVAIAFSGLNEEYEILLKPTELMYYNDLVACMGRY